MRLEGIGVGELGAVFERAGGGSSCGDDAAAFRKRGVDSCSGGCGQCVVLGMEMDVREVLGANGLKGSEAYVKGNGLDLDSVLSELSEDLWREVKTGGWSGG